MTHPETMEARIRRAVGEYAGLRVDVRKLSEADDLYAAGMTSHASVEVMLALENDFDVEFPDRLFNRSVFESISSLKAALDELTGDSTVVGAQ